MYKKVNLAVALTASIVNVTSATDYTYGNACASNTN